MCFGLVYIMCNFSYLDQRSYIYIFINLANTAFYRY